MASSEPNRLSRVALTDILFWLSTGSFLGALAAPYYQGFGMGDSMIAGLALMLYMAIFASGIASLAATFETGRPRAVAYLMADSWKFGFGTPFLLAMAG